MRVERTALLTDSFDHARIAVTRMRHVVLAIQILSPLGIPKPCAFCLNERPSFKLGFLVPGKMTPCVISARKCVAQTILCILNFRN